MADRSTNLAAQWQGAALALLFAAMTGCGSIMETFTPPSPSERAREAFITYDADKRRRAINDLSAASFGGEEPYVKMYRLLASDSDPTVRAACAKALGMHGTVEDVEQLLRALNDEYAFVRWESAKALQRIHHPDAANPLAKAVTADEDADVRQAAADAVGQYPVPAVFTALIAALDDREYSVVHAAAKSLHTLTGQDLGKDAQAWLAWSDENRQNLFDGQLTYYWAPYQKPRGLLDKIQFWKEYTPPQPQRPVGADPDAEVDDQSASR